MEKISWTDYVRNDDVLRPDKEERNILNRIKRRNANWIGHILSRSCFLNQVIELKIVVRIQKERRTLLDDLTETRSRFTFTNFTRSHFCGELALEYAMDLS